MIHVILVEPEHPGNIGAVARVMKNFNAGRLILVNPKADHLSKEARNRAKWAQDVLENVKVLKRFPRIDCLVATTAKLGSDYNIPRSPLTPSQLAQNLGGGDVGLVFGREATGLTNEEVKKCDFVVSIPANPRYPVLNLSHSVAVMLYELSKQGFEDRYEAASKKEKDIIMDMLNDIMGALDFSTKEKKQTQEVVWRKLLGKSFLTKREAYALLGFFNKVKNKVSRTSRRGRS